MYSINSNSVMLAVLKFLAIWGPRSVLPVVVVGLIALHSNGALCDLRVLGELNVLATRIGDAHHGKDRRAGLGV